MKRQAIIAATLGHTLCFGLLLPACTSNIYRYSVLPHSYKVLEMNSEKSLQLVIVDYAFRGPANVKGLDRAAFLTESAPHVKKDFWALLEKAPASRVFAGPNIWADLEVVTDAMTDASPDKYKGDGKMPIFWIISLNPPVVAESIERIDATKLAIFYDGTFLAVARLAGSKDLAEKAVAIYALDEFPPNPGVLTGKEANEWKQAIAARTRRTRLREPTPLGAIFKNPSLWQK